jgi:chemotaxis protein CheZ
MMTDMSFPHADRLAKARAVVAALERGDETEAERILDEMWRVRENRLFEEICRLTRQLHEALGTFSADVKLADLTENAIPDARERLRYVITLTEQAASTTLNAVETVLPVVEGLNARLSLLTEQWERFLRRKMPYQEFKALSQDISVFLEHLKQDTELLQQQLSEVMMAQSFQDLTGQIIRRVIELVEQAEDSLIQLIRVSGKRAQRVSTPAEPLGLAAGGPAVPGLDQAAVANQDEVDDLLSSLGF